METKIIFSTIKQDFNLLRQVFDFLSIHKNENSNCIRLFISGLEVKAYFDDNSLITFSFHSIGNQFIFAKLKKDSYSETFPTYSDDTIVKIASELSGKTKLLKKLKKKLRNSYTLGRLEKILQSKKSFKQSPWDYEGMYGFDDNGYRRDNDKNEAEVQLLQDLIDSKKKKRWFYY